MKKIDYLKAFIIIIFIVVFNILIFFISNFYYYNKINYIVLDKDNNIIISLKNNNLSYCSLGTNTNNLIWTKVQDKKCIVKYKTDTDKVFLKNIFGKVVKYDNIYDLAKVTKLEILNSKIYLAINGTEKIEYIYESLGKIDEVITFESKDEDIATVDNNGVITGLSNGKTSIKVIYKNLVDTIEVYVTDMVDLISKEYDYNKELLTCNKYSKEQNDFLDEILRDRVEDAGYKTRAGVVAAARFLTLEFPYRIPYFYENGRTNKYGMQLTVEGEGRYYKKGLYLDESRFENIKLSAKGPGTWGCEVYSIPTASYSANGLDCSGFISWILYNGGYDPGDIGAGITGTPDMTDLGKRIYIMNSISNNTIKAGDLLSGATAAGGHIALVAGIDDENYYIAESLWPGSGYFGAVLRTYKKSNLANYFYWHIDMNEYYKEDGNYSVYWK